MVINKFINLQNMLLIFQFPYFVPASQVCQNLISGMVKKWSLQQIFNIKYCKFKTNRSNWKMNNKMQHSLYFKFLIILWLLPCSVIISYDIKHQYKEKSKLDV